MIFYHQHHYYYHYHYELFWCVDLPPYLPPYQPTWLFRSQRAATTGRPAGRDETPAEFGPAQPCRKESETAHTGGAVQRDRPVRGCERVRPGQPEHALAARDIPRPAVIRHGATHLLTECMYVCVCMYVYMYICLFVCMYYMSIIVCGINKHSYLCIFVCM